MSYLAVDPLAIRRLRGALADVADGLSRQHSSDPLAAAALATARAAHHEVADHWLGVIAAVVDCRALTGAVPSTGLDALIPTGLAAAGWRVTAAPTPPGWVPRHLSVAEATALGDRLNGATTTNDLGGLTDLLRAAAADGRTAAAFAASFTEWAALIEHLARCRQGRLFDGQPTAEVDAAVAALADLAGAAPNPGLLAGRLATDAAPDAAGPLIVRMDLGDVQVGVLVAELFRRRITDGRVQVSAERQESLAAALLPALARRPAAARAFLDELGDDPDPLFWSGADPSTVRALLAAAMPVDPDAAADAGRVLAQLIDGYQRVLDRRIPPPGEVPWGVVLAEISVPWLALFGPARARGGWDAGDARRRLDLLVAHGGAAVLEDRSSAWMARPAARVQRADGALDLGAIDELTGTWAALDDSLRRHHLADAADRRFWVEPIATLVNLVAAEQAPQAAVGGMRQLAQQWGLLPDDESQALAAADRGWDTRTGRAGAVVFLAVARSMIGRGELPAAAAADLARPGEDDGSCRSQQARRRIDAFIARWASGPTAERLWAVRNAALDDPAVSAACR